MLIPILIIMAQTAIFTLTSELHDEQAVDTVTKDFLDSLGVDHLFRGSVLTICSGVATTPIMEAIHST